jgi:hypothetical protein
MARGYEKRVQLLQVKKVKLIQLLRILIFSPLTARDFLVVARREAAAEVDQVEVNAGLDLDPVEELAGLEERVVPLRRVGLLRADVKRDPAWLQAELGGLDNQIAGHVGAAPELARERPLGPLVRGQDPAEDLGARGRPRDLLELDI